MNALMHDDDGKRWLRMIAADGTEWDEPITGWTLLLDLIRGLRSWRHDDGRTARDIT
jgi:hypothetical protein